MPTTGRAEGCPPALGNLRSGTQRGGAAPIFPGVPRRRDPRARGASVIRDRRRSITAPSCTPGEPAEAAAGKGRERAIPPFPDAGFPCVYQAVSPLRVCSPPAP